MPIQEIGLPLRKPLWKGVQFAYISKTDDHPFSNCGSLLYLRTSRMGPIGPASQGLLGRCPLRWQYPLQAGYYARQLADAFGTTGFDAVLTPPSRYPFSHTYKTAFLQSGKIQKDLSGLFHRHLSIYAGSGASFANYFGAISCNGGEELAGCKSLLIVDDILWRGVTAAAILEHLRMHGLSSKTRIHMACPLWIA